MESATRPTETVEDYLQLIYTMQREGTPVIAARIKERKGVSAPTAWATLKRMERDGLVLLADDHHITLSQVGQEKAESIIRRHMLAERLLTDILKLDWADVHDEAHKMEHAISPLIERQILQLLGTPETCPHGNPIPGSANAVDPGPLTPLASVSGPAVVRRIDEEIEARAEFMLLLEERGLMPGVPVTVYGAVGNEVAVETDNGRGEIPAWVAERVYAGRPA